MSDELESIREAVAISALAGTEMAGSRDVIMTAPATAAEIAMFNQDVP